MRESFSASDVTWITLGEGVDVSVELLDVVSGDRKLGGALNM